jgi:hypothetical protein
MKRFRGWVFAAVGMTLVGSAGNAAGTRFNDQFPITGGGQPSVIAGSTMPSTNPIGMGWGNPGPMPMVDHAPAQQKSEQITQKYLAMVMNAIAQRNAQIMAMPAMPCPGQNLTIGHRTVQLARELRDNLKSDAEMTEELLQEIRRYGDAEIMAYLGNPNAEAAPGASSAGMAAGIKGKLTSQIGAAGDIFKAGSSFQLPELPATVSMGNAQEILQKLGTARGEYAQLLAAFQKGDASGDMLSGHLGSLLGERLPGIDLNLESALDGATIPGLNLPNIPGIPDLSSFMKNGQLGGMDFLQGQIGKIDALQGIFGNPGQLGNMLNNPAMGGALAGQLQGVMGSGAASAVTSIAGSGGSALMGFRPGGMGGRSARAVMDVKKFSERIQQWVGTPDVPVDGAIRLLGARPRAATTGSSTGNAPAGSPGMISSPTASLPSAGNLPLLGTTPSRPGSSSLFTRSGTDARNDFLSGGSR